MSFERKNVNAGIRCPGHDYRSKCIYHIVLKKAEGFPKFSEVIGIPGNRDWKPRINPFPAGKVIAEAISGLKRQFPHTSILRRCIMPDHVHLAIYVREPTDIHLGIIIRQLKKDCSRLWEKLGNPAETRFFIPDYHDNFLTDKCQLDRMLAYISDNPRRHLVRLNNEGWFRHFKVSDGINTFDAYGNWDLIGEPLISAVRFSRRFSEGELRIRKRQWMTSVLNGGILVSPFIHENEKKVRDWAIDNGAALIYITYKPFPERYKPEGKMFDLCAEGRLMIISIPQPESWLEYIRQNGKPPRAACLQMNDYAQSIAEGHFHLQF